MSAEFLSGVMGRSLPPTPETALLWHIRKVCWLWHIRKVCWKVAACEALHRISAREFLAASHRHHRAPTIAGRLLGPAILDAKSHCQQNANDNCNDYAYNQTAATLFFWRVVVDLNFSFLIVVAVDLIVVSVHDN